MNLPAKLITKTLALVVFTAALTFMLTVPGTADDLFSDVPADHWAVKALEQLTQKGIIEGLPGGVFRGERTANRFEVAVVLFKALDGLDTLAGQPVSESSRPVDDSDMDMLKKLTAEFANEMATMGVTLAWVEDELKILKQTMQENIQITNSHMAETAPGRHGAVTVTGDTWIHYDVLEYANDTVDDDKDIFYQVALNMAAAINESTRIFVRLVNDDVAGAKMEDLEDGTVGVDVAYVETEDLFGQDIDVKAGRQYVDLGQGVVLADKLDALVFSRPVGAFDVSLLLADQEDDVFTENGFSLTGITARYDFGDYQSQLYFLQGSQVANTEPYWYGLSLEGPLMPEAGPFKNVEYQVEYARYDPDTAFSPVGSAWRAAVNWDMAQKLKATFTFGKGDEEFQPIGIHYWRRPYDLFGAMSFGQLPAGSTLATGSLSGIEDAAIIIDHGVSEKLSVRFIHEKVSVNDNSPAVTNLFDYKRDSLGLDYRYRPNTSLEVSWDKVTFDRADSISQLEDSGGWDRYRMGLRVKF